MNSNVVAAIVTFLGGLAIVLIGIWMHDRQARDATRIAHASSAYGKYIEAVAAVAMAQQRLRDVHQQDQPARAAAARAEDEALAALAAAKGEITLYGEGPVLEALSRVGGDLSTCHGTNSFLAAVEAIRAYVGADTVPREHLEAILFGS